MYLSEKLIAELREAKIIKANICETKAKLIIRQFFIKIHYDAVLNTIIATNKKTYVEPQFTD